MELVSDDFGLSRHQPAEHAAAVAALAQLCLVALDAYGRRDGDGEELVRTNLQELGETDLRSMLARAIELLAGVGIRAFQGVEGAREWLEVVQMQAMSDLSAYESEEGQSG